MPVRYTTRLCYTTRNIKISILQSSLHTRDILYMTSRRVTPDLSLLLSTSSFPPRHTQSLTQTFKFVFIGMQKNLTQSTHLQNKNKSRVFIS